MGEAKAVPHQTRGQALGGDARGQRVNENIRL